MRTRLGLYLGLRPASCAAVAIGPLARVTYVVSSGMELVSALGMVVSVVAALAMARRILSAALILESA
jgi:hypothetical protein